MIVVTPSHRSTSSADSWTSSWEGLRYPVKPTGTADAGTNFPTPTFQNPTDNVTSPVDTAKLSEARKLTNSAESWTSDRLSGMSPVTRALRRAWLPLGGVMRFRGPPPLLPARTAVRSECLGSVAGACRNMASLVPPSIAPLGGRPVLLAVMPVVLAAMPNDTAWAGRLVDMVGLAQKVGELPDRAGTSGRQEQE